MALVLGLREGKKFRVGQHQFGIHRIKSETGFILSHEGIYYDIDDVAAKVVAKGVSIKCGKRGQRHLARVCIEADRALRITRVED
jgi:hypothetical protein